MNSVKELIRMFEERKNKLSMVLNDKNNICIENRKTRIMGAIDEIDFLLRTLRQNDSFSGNKALGSSETSRSYVFSAEDVGEMCSENTIIEQNEEVISPEEPQVAHKDTEIVSRPLDESHVPAVLRPSFSGEINTQDMKLRVSEGIFKQVHEKLRKTRGSADAAYDKVMPKDVNIQRSYYIG